MALTRYSNMEHIFDRRIDLRHIADIIPPNSRVLDIGCGDGSLLGYLKTTKHVDGRGIEIDPFKVNHSLNRGLAVIQGDAEIEIPQYPSQSFDYVILAQTLPATKNPVQMLYQTLRVGKKVIVSFPNFAYWRVRLHLLLKGTMPVTGTLNKSWFETENIHLFTIKDFLNITKKLNLTIIDSYSVTDNKLLSIYTNGFWANIIAEQAIFIVEKK